ncbi:MAG: M20 family metallopeptidase, partial [bacterium]
VDKIERMAVTGVVGYLNNNGNKTILIRADMDGLPIKEENECDYRSLHEDVMHACGHDAHMAVLISLVKYFYENRDRLKVNLKYMFQPAEEGGAGAKKMIEEGVLENVDYALAIHVWNDLEYGKIALNYGPTMASSDSFEIEIIGKGTHAATPYLGVDPILTASSFINQIYNLFPRIFKDYVLTFTYINAGSATNIIPEKCVLKGTVRNFSEETRKQIALEFEKILKNVCNTYSARYILKYEFGYPVLINDKRLYQIGKEVGVKLVGQENLLDFKTFGSEDMAFVLQKVPGLYVAIGSGKGNPHHSPRFDINENAMLLAFEFLKNMVYAIQEKLI